MSLTPSGQSLPQPSSAPAASGCSAARGNTDLIRNDASPFRAEYTCCNRSTLNQRLNYHVIVSCSCSLCLSMQSVWPIRGAHFNTGKDLVMLKAWRRCCSCICDRPSACQRPCRDVLERCGTTHELLPFILAKSLFCICRTRLQVMHL